MQTETILNSKNGYSLVRVDQLGIDGNFITHYEVRGPDGNVLKSFGNGEDAETYFQSMPDRRPDPSHEPRL